MQRTLPDEDRELITLAERSQEQLTYFVHDMRSVTTSVSLMVDLLELAAKAEGDSTQRARAESAQKSCQQMALLCTDAARLLTGADDSEPEPEVFSLLGLLVEAVTVYSPVFDLAGKTLRLDSKCGSVEAFGNRSRLFRAVSNLLDNGLRHTSSGSTVAISCADVFKEFAISVSDDGPGLGDIATSETISIDAFVADVRRSPAEEGVFAPGTGLKFVSEVATMHGGRSTVEQNDRGGTKFTLILPKS